MIFNDSSEGNLQKLTDQELVSWILQNAPTPKLRSGQEELYHRYAGKIYHKCISLIKNKEVAKDLTHDIFIKIFLNLSRYNGKSPFYSWVFAITYNYCFDHLKKERKSHHLEISAVSDTVVADDTGIQYQLFKEAKLSALEEAFESLKPAERLILKMYYQDKMPVKTIAALLEAGESAVKMRLKRSREQLSELIKSASDGEK